MKKLWTILLATLVIAALAMVVSAAEPTILWDFDSDEAMSEVMGSPTSMMFYGEDDYYAFMATAADCYVTINTPVDDVNDVQWAKIRVKNPTTAVAVELFGATNNRGLSGPECTHINIEPECDEWKTYIINVFESNMITANTWKGASLDTTHWMGNVNSIRLDPMWKPNEEGKDSGGSMNPGDEIYIDYVAFFKTEEDAKAFRADQDNPSDKVEQYRTEEAVVPVDMSIPETVDTSSTEPTLVWNFGADEEMSKVMGTSSNVTWAAEEDYYVFTTVTQDTNVMINTTAKDARLIQWVKVRVKNPSTATAIELYPLSNYRGISGDSCTHIDIDAESNEWKTYIIDLFASNLATANTFKGSTLEKTYHEGAIQSIRLDPMWKANEEGKDSGGSMTEGEQIYIDYIAFFANEEAAKAYDPNAVVEEPAVEEPKEEVVETPAVEEPKEEVVETPAVEEPKEEVVEAPAATAPQTFDIAAVLAVLTAVCGMGLTVIRKRK